MIQHFKLNNFYFKFLQNYNRSCATPSNQEYKSFQNFFGNNESKLGIRI